MQPLAGCSGTVSTWSTTSWLQGPGGNAPAKLSVGQINYRGLGFSEGVTKIAPKFPWRVHRNASGEAVELEVKVDEFRDIHEGNFQGNNCCLSSSCSEDKTLKAPRINPENWLLLRWRVKLDSDESSFTRLPWRFSRMRSMLETSKPPSNSEPNVMRTDMSSSESDSLHGFLTLPTSKRMSPQLESPLVPQINLLNLFWLDVLVMADSLQCPRHLRSTTISALCTGKIDKYTPTLGCNRPPLLSS